MGAVLQTEISFSCVIDVSSKFAEVANNLHKFHVDMPLASLVAGIKTLFSNDQSEPKTTVTVIVRDLIPKQVQQYHIARELVIICKYYITFCVL